MVVGFASIMGADGEKKYPGKDQGGVQIGDVITGVDGKAISSELQLARIIDQKENNPVRLHIKRKTKSLFCL